MNTLHRVLRSFLLPVTLMGSAAAAANADRDWHFEVFVGDKLIGSHHFRLTDEGQAQRLLSRAEFRYKVLGLTLYRYEHQSEEIWRDGCLQSIEASTDDNGKDLQVRGAVDGDEFELRTEDATRSLSGCIMTFAYWNPAILERQRLLNTQNGQYMPVDVQPVGNDDRDTQRPDARQWRIKSEGRDIDLWYDADGEWQALRSTTRDGRPLQYQRVPAPPSPGAFANE